MYHAPKGHLEGSYTLNQDSWRSLQIQASETVAKSESDSSDECELTH